MSGAYYEIRVRGEVGDLLVRQFENLEASTEPVETVLHGTLRDRSELHTLLERIDLLGLELIDVHRAATDPAALSGGRRSEA